MYFLSTSVPLLPSLLLSEKDWWDDVKEDVSRGKSEGNWLSEIHLEEW